MRIGAIGTGNIGATAAALFAGGGHEVMIANSRGPESLTDLARDAGATPGTVEDAARHGEVVLVAIPFGAIVSGLIEELGFAAVDAGGLAGGGRRLQPGSPVYAKDLAPSEAAKLLER